MSVVDQAAEADGERQTRRHELIYGYLPKDKLLVDPSLGFHQEEDLDLDPITYEVIRSKLWNLNIDHGETVRRTSGSFPVADANDFNASLATETGEGTAFGPYQWFFAGYADLVIRWTLEHRSHNPGIADADVFIQNDPWVGTNHQNDAAVFSPVFCEGKVFAWIYNCVHQRDLGGTVPGSIAPNAASVYDEATFFPPLKLVEAGLLREDILDVWTRRSRHSEISALEVKSQLAGVNFARQRFLEIVDRYGPKTVKRAMNKTLEDSSRTVGERLSRLPDGIWRDERYMAGATADDPRPYKLCLSYEIRGDRLRVSNAGTDPAVGSFNFTTGAFRGSVVSGLFHALAFDVDLCGGGLLRQIDFDVEPGRINSAIHPTAVGSSIGMIVSCSQAHSLAAKMVSGSPDLARHGFAPCTVHTLASAIFYGTDQYGNQYQNALLDDNGGGGGAFVDRDGLDNSGSSLGVSKPIPDVENVERGMPLLCLYRQEALDSGGPGRFRGAPAIVSAWVGHNSDDSYCIMSGLLPHATMGRGVDGALPASAGSDLYALESTCQAWFEGGRIPATPSDLRVAAPELVHAVKELRPFRTGSVYQALSNAAAGYGDPLARSPELVAGDLAGGRVSIPDAGHMYGVVIGADGRYDESSTCARRGTLIASRLSASRQPREPMIGSSSDAPESERVIASVALAGGILCCWHCGWHLAQPRGSYRLGCRELDERPSTVSAHLRDSDDTAGEPLVVRRYLCPGCGIALDSEICRAGDEPYWDVQVTGSMGTGGRRPTVGGDGNGAAAPGRLGSP
jgi:N-methylhydantoinase B